MALLALAIFGLPLLAVAAFAFARNPVWAIWVILGLYLFETISLSNEGVDLGISIYPSDLVFIALFCSALIRLLSSGQIRRVDKALLALTLLVLFSLMRGMAAYGTKTAGVEVRGVFYSVVSMLYFNTCRINTGFLKRLCDVWLRACAVLLAITVFRWIAVVFGLGITAQFTDSMSGNSMRVVNAGTTFFLATGFLMSFYLESRKRGPLWQRKLLYHIGPAVLLLQHRTVWLLLIVCFIWMGWSDRRFRKWLPIGLVAMAIIGVIVTAVVFGSGTDVGARLTDSATSDVTFIWRLAGWVQLLSGFFASGASALLLGNPFGAGWTRVLDGGIVEAAPHNYYVLILLRTGFLGLFALILLYRNAMRKAHFRTAYPEWRFWTAATITQLVYNITYGVHYEQGMILGVVIAMRPLPQKAVHRRRIHVVTPAEVSLPQSVEGSLPENLS